MRAVKGPGGRGLTAAALAVAALALAGCDGEPDISPGPPPPAPGEGKPALGFNDNFPAAMPGAELLAGSGAAFGRTPVQWSALEPRPEELDFSTVDAKAEELERRGLRPLWVLIDAPCWATGRPDCDPDEIARSPAPGFFEAYAELVVKLAERYPQSLAIEIWNEPNVPKFWGPSPDPGAYRALVRTTARAMERAGSGVPLVLAGPAPVGPAEAAATPKVESTGFLARTLGDDPPAVQAVGLHPYGLGPGNQVARSLRRFEREAEVVAARAPGIPAWVTEVGLTTAGLHAVSPAAQAHGLADLYERLRERDVPVIAVHRFADLADPPFPFEAGFGVVSAEGEPKPSYCALAEVAGAEPANC